MVRVMKTMKKWLAGILVFALAVLAWSAGEEVKAENLSVSLTIQMPDSGRNREGISFSLYQVTDGIETDRNGQWALTAAFAKCGLTFSVSTAEETEVLIEKLSEWVSSQKIEPTAAITTNKNGEGKADSLAEGMYLVIPGKADDYEVIASSLLLLPGRDENGNLLYQNVLIPKFTLRPEESTEESTEETTEESTEETTEESTEETTEESTEETTEESEATTEETAEETTAPEETTPAPVVPTTPGPVSPENPILGVNDISPYLGMAFLAVGILLIGLAAILSVQRKMRK